MKKTNKLVALIVALLLLFGATAASASTYVSDPVSPAIAGSSEGEEQPAEELQTEEPQDEQVPEEGAEEADAVVKTEDENGSVNIRSAASTSSEILGTLSGDMHVTILGTEGDWAKIRADGIVGYVFSKYLQVSAPEETPVPEETPAPEEVAREVRLSTTLGDVVNVGDTITMTAQLIGFDGLTVQVQWQQNAGSGWRDVSGANGLSFSYIANADTVNSQWRVAVTIVG